MAGFEATFGPNVTRSVSAILPRCAFVRPPMSTARRTHGFRESVIRGMSRLAREHRAINLAQGFPNFPGARPPQGSGGARDSRRHQPVRDHLGCAATPGGAGALLRAVVRPVRRSGAGDHRHLWRHRGHDLDAARAGRSGRRSDRLRALLRELRARYHPRRCAAGLRAARAGPAARSRSPRGSVLAAHPRDHREHAEQSFGAGVDAGGAGSDSRPLCEPRRARGDRRDLRAHPVRGRAHSHRDVARHARAHGNDQRGIEDLQRHRLACRMDRRTRATHRRHSEGARLSHCRCTRAAAGRRRGGARGARRFVLRRPWRRVTAASATFYTARSSRRGLPAERPRAPTTSWRISAR